MMFWAISLGLGAVAALTLARALWRTSDGEAAGFDVQVYRDQLGEVDRDLARGVLSESEAEAVRTEVSRRLLEADKVQNGAVGPDGAPNGATVAAALAVILAVAGGGTGLYLWLGQPGYRDLPLERRIALAEEVRLSRPGQVEAEADVPASPPVEEPDENYLNLVAQLRTAVAARPEELEGFQLLARHEARLGNFAAAHAAQARVIELKGEAATAQDHVDHAELLVLAAGGYVSPEAENALGEALSRDPGHGAARYYSGLLAIQTGRPDIAFRLWRRLLEESPPGAPWLPPVRAQIMELAQLAGVDYTPPVAAPGPSAGDVAAAEDMSPEDRAAMIESMVAGLADRLANEGGTPDDWARLIQAYGVLGETERASAIWAEAQETFPEDVVQTIILPAARSAGLAE